MVLIRGAFPGAERSIRGTFRTPRYPEFPCLGGNPKGSMRRRPDEARASIVVPLTMEKPLSKHS